MVIHVKMPILSVAMVLCSCYGACYAYAEKVRDAEAEKAIFEVYFPDSNEAGEELNDWWKNKKTESLGDNEALDLIRRGFRRTKWNKMNITGYVGSRCLRNPDSEIRAKAIDLLYNATFSPEGHLRHFAIYFGLANIPDKSAEILERFAKLAVSNESVNRIVWGVKYSKQVNEFMIYVEPYVSSPDEHVRKHAEELKELFIEEIEHWEDWRPQSHEQKLERRDDVSYETAFAELYETLGLSYPCFEMKGIDWDSVGEEFLPRAGEVEDDEQFGALCLELVAKLEDSHSQVLPGAIDLPTIAVPQWDAGFSCLEDDKGRPAVYYIDPCGPADKAGVKLGMVVTNVAGSDVSDTIEEATARMKKYGGFSSERHLRYFGFHFFMRQMEKGSVVEYEMLDTASETHKFQLASELGNRYLPRLPVPVEGIRDSANVSWKMLSDNIGYIYVRRMRDGLEAALDKAVSELKDARGLIVDVRGNTGGGFESSTSHVNFYTDLVSARSTRPQYTGPIAVLIDNRCISAGEGWASWFVAKKRARLFGQTTAGASSAKEVYVLKNCLYKVKYTTRTRTGFLDRPIEGRGIEPDVEVIQTAEDLARGRDTVLEAAREYLLNLKSSADN